MDQFDETDSTTHDEFDLFHVELVYVFVSCISALLSRYGECEETDVLICFSIYGIYYLMFTTFANLFHNTYGFSTGIGGLVYLGLGIGFLTATMFGARTGDYLYQWVSVFKFPPAEGCLVPS